MKVVHCRVPSDLPLYDILNEFQRGSHMAAVTKVKSKQEKKPGDEPKKASTNNDANNNNNDVEKGMMLDDHLRIVRKNNTKIDENEAYYHVDAGDVIGIITLEDVMEELLQVHPTLSPLFFFHIVSLIFERRLHYYME